MKRYGEIILKNRTERDKEKDTEFTEINREEEMRDMFERAKERKAKKLTNTAGLRGSDNGRGRIALVPKMDRQAKQMRLKETAGSGEEKRDQERP